MAMGLDGMVGCGIKTGTIIMSRILSSTYKAMDTTALQVIPGIFCTNSFLNSMSYLLPSPASFLVRLAISEVG